MIFCTIFRPKSMNFSQFILGCIKFGQKDIILMQNCWNIRNKWYICTITSISEGLLMQTERKWISFLLNALKLKGFVKSRPFG